jgi:hypothetical protein
MTSFRAARLGHFTRCELWRIAQRRSLLLALIQCENALNTALRACAPNHRGALICANPPLRSGAGSSSRPDSPNRSVPERARKGMSSRAREGCSASNPRRPDGTPCSSTGWATLKIGMMRCSKTSFALGAAARQGTTNQALHAKHANPKTIRCIFNQPSLGRTVEHSWRSC